MEKDTTRKVNGVIFTVGDDLDYVVGGGRHVERGTGTIKRFQGDIAIVGLKKSSFEVPVNLRTYAN